MWIPIKSTNDCPAQLGSSTRRVLSFILLALGLFLKSQGQAAEISTNAEVSASPWWDDYPLIVQASFSLPVTLSYNGTVGFPWTQVDPSWGIYGQRLLQNASLMSSFHNAGIRTMSYFETFGQSTLYIFELDTKGQLDYTPSKANFWNWQIYGGGPIRWVGPQNYFDNEDFTGIWNRNHPRYGGRAMTYPDGTVATGYLNKFPGIGGDPTTDPRNSRVLDAGASKSILGDLTVDIAYQETVNAIDPETGKPKGPLDGLIKINVNGQDKYTGHFDVSKDTACPFWIDLQYASTLYAADQGLDSIWTDNYGTWDNFNYWTTRVAFGDWSVAKFRDHLKTNFTSAQLTAMGVADVDTFDILTSLRNQCKAWGGVDTNVDHPRWSDPRWVDHPLWRAYKIFKRQIGTQALKNFYDATKQAAALSGKPDFLVAGNGPPFYDLGWARGDLDLVSTETWPDWHMANGTRGIMLPPRGRYAPMYRMAREHAKSRLVNVWFYLQHAYSQYQKKPGIANVLYYEMLASNALPMHFPSNPLFPGAMMTNAAFFQFVKDTKAILGKRVPVEDIGIYYSTSSMLALMAPGGFPNMDRQPHTFGLYGWGTVLSELHTQCRPIPEWKLSPESLAPLRLLVIPDADVFDPADVSNILEPWVRAGGRLIVTGNSGYRQGESGNFEPNVAGLSLAPLTGVSSLAGAPARQMRQVGAGQVLYLRDNIGMTFYLADSQRPSLRAPFKTALTDIMAGQSPLVLTPDPSMPETVGLTLYEDASAKRFFIDVNNVNIDLPSDTITATPPLKFTVRLPVWMRNTDKIELKTQVLAPIELAGNEPAPPTVQLKRLNPDRAEITLDPVFCYASVVLEATEKPLTVTELSRPGYLVENLQVGKKVYTDRAYQFTAPIPPRFQDQLYIQTMNQDKDLAGDDFLSFNVNQFVTVYVALDERIATPASWLKGWSKLDERLTTDDSSPGRTIYAHNFEKGRITLGANFEAGMRPGSSMYTVVIVPSNNAVVDWNHYR